VTKGDTAKAAVDMREPKFRPRMRTRVPPVVGTPSDALAAMTDVTTGAAYRSRSGCTVVSWSPAVRTMGSADPSPAGARKVTSVCERTAPGVATMPRVASEQKYTGKPPTVTTGQVPRLVPTRRMNTDPSVGTSTVAPSVYVHISYVARSVGVATPL